MLHWFPFKYTTLDWQYALIFTFIAHSKSITQNARQASTLSSRRNCNHEQEGWKRHRGKKGQNRGLTFITLNQFSVRRVIMFFSGPPQIGFYSIKEKRTFIFMANSVMHKQIQDLWELNRPANWCHAWRKNHITSQGWQSGEGMMGRSWPFSLSFAICTDTALTLAMWLH